MNNKKHTMMSSPKDSEKLIPASNNVTVIRTESPSKARKDFLLRIGAALFYGVASFMIMVVNKHVLTVHKFPSFQVSSSDQHVPDVPTSFRQRLSIKNSTVKTWNTRDFFLKKNFDYCDLTDLGSLNFQQFLARRPKNSNFTYLDN